MNFFSAVSIVCAWGAMGFYELTLAGESTIHAARFCQAMFYIFFILNNVFEDPVTALYRDIINEIERRHRRHKNPQEEV